MDKQLLKALDNLGNALELLTDALMSKKEAKSDTAQAISGGDFGKQLETINTGIKQIKVDTQQILKNQQTIIDLQRKKESDKKSGEIEEAGGEKKQSNIKKGVQTILLIAIAVLAIGLAFKIVGKVDFLSVIALGLAIVLVAIAFERVAKSGLTPKGALMASLSLVAMSLGVFLSSLILSKVAKISLSQFISAVMIASLFYFIAPVMASIIDKLQREDEIEVWAEGKGGVKKKTKRMDWGKLIGMVIFLPLLMVSMALGIMVASRILAMVKPMTIQQAISVIIIAGVFSVIAYGIKGLITALTDESETSAQAKGFGGSQKQKGLNLGKLLAVALILPLIMLSISVGIWLSSMILGNVKPIGISAAFSAILISLIFTVAAFGMAKLIKALDSVSPQKAVMAAIALPLLLPAMSLSIWLSSLVLSKVRPISFTTFLSSIMIAALFVVLSFAISPLMRNIGRLNYKDLPKIPIFFTLMSLAIALSAGIFFLFKKPIDGLGFITILKILFFGAAIAVVALIMAFVVKIAGKMDWKMVIKLPVFLTLMALGLAVSAWIIGKFQKSIDKLTFATILKLLIFGIVLGIVAIVMAITMKVIKMLKIGVLDAIKGGLVIVIIAGVITLSSLILNKGKYDNYPKLGWVIGVAAAIGGFALGAFALGASVFGPQALVFAAGLATILVVAGTIVAVSKILAKGKYELPGFLEWSKAVALLYATFTPIYLVLGALGAASAVMSFFGGPNPLKEAEVAILQIATTIVSVSKILKKGEWAQGPTEAWAKGVSIAIGAFAPVYKMLTDNAIWDVFGMGGIGPKDFTKAILIVSAGIVTAAKFFAENKAAFLDGPPIKWAKGVGAAIGAFSPVYKVLLGEGRSLFDKIFGGPGPKPEDMAKAIRTISEGIIVAAKFFAKNKVAFKEGNYPSKKWGKGVGAAIGAFAPVFQVLSGKSWYQSDDEVIAGMVKAIKAVSRAIISSGQIFKNAGDGIFDPKKAPSKKWASGVSAAIEAFGSVFEYLFANQGWFTDGDTVINDMTNAIRRISYAIADVAREFGAVGEQNWKAYPSSAWGKNISSLNETMTNSAMFLVEQWGESDYEIGWGLWTMANKMKKVAREFNGAASWQSPDKKWGASVAWNMKFFSRLARWMDDNGSFMGTEMLVYTAEKMGKIAKKLHSARRAFDYSIPDNFLPNLRKNMLDFQSLVHELAKNEEKGILEMMGDAFGRAMGEKDPIIQMANRMVALAKGYSALAKSLTQLGAAMKSVNAKSLTELGSLTKGVAGKPVDVKKEEKQGLFQSMKSSFTSFGGGEEKKEKSGFQPPPKNKKNSISYLSEKMEEMIKVMQSIKKDTNSLDAQVMKMKDGKIKAEVDSSGFGLDN